MSKRVFLIVLDSFGCGEMPDAAAFGDAGANTLKSVASSQFFKAPNLLKLGLFNIDGVTEEPKCPVMVFTVHLIYGILSVKER